MENVIKYTGSECKYGSLTGYVTLPSDYKEGERLPMIVFLHGAGEVGKSTPKTLDKVLVHGVPKYFVKDPDYKGLRVITASPQCIDGYIWDQLTLMLKDWIDEVAEKFGADEKKSALRVSQWAASEHGICSAPIPIISVVPLLFAAAVFRGD